MYSLIKAESYIDQIETLLKYGLIKTKMTNEEKLLDKVSKIPHDEWKVEIEPREVSFTTTLKNHHVHLLKNALYVGNIAIYGIPASHIYDSVKETKDKRRQEERHDRIKSTFKSILEDEYQEQA